MPRHPAAEASFRADANPWRLAVACSNGYRASPLPGMRREGIVEVLLFTIVGIVLYVAAAAALNALEHLHGSPLPHRNLVYFAIILLLALATFGLLRTLLPSLHAM